MRIVVWWCIPCKGIFPVFEEYNKMYGNVRFIVEKDNSKNREKLGWEVQQRNSQLIYESLAQNEWENKVDSILEEESDSIHIFNGIRTFPKVYYALKKANLMNLSYGFIAEAPHNPYKGIKKILKDIFTNIVTPIIIKKYIKKSNFYFSASGDTKEKIKNLGFTYDKIFPFGYFTEMVKVNKTIKKDKKIKLICTGYLTKNKGHILLLKALKGIGELNQNFECNITGFGPERNCLEKFVIENKIPNVNFLGVISNSELDELMRSSHILVAPGYEEPWGIRINEAIMYSLPVISSSGIGASQVIKDLSCGLVFKRGSYLDLASCLLRYLNELNLYSEHFGNVENSKKQISPMTAAHYLHDVLATLNHLKELRGQKPWLIF